MVAHENGRGHAGAGFGVAAAVEGVPAGVGDEVEVAVDEDAVGGFAEMGACLFDDGAGGESCDCLPGCGGVRCRDG